MNPMNTAAGTLPDDQDLMVAEARAVDLLRDLAEESIEKGRRSSGLCLLGLTTEHQSDFDTPIVEIVTALAKYADAHKLTYDSPVGESYTLGQHWLLIAQGVHGLLNGERGRLDGGDVSEILHEMKSLVRLENEEL